MTERMTNAQIVRIIAEAAPCSRATARKALEHGWRTIRVHAVRGRVEDALRKNRALVAQYSKEHYP